MYKKILLIFLLLNSAGAALVSCARFNNSLPMKIINIDAVVSVDTYSLTYSENLDFSEVKMYDKNNHSKIVTKLYPGDYLEVYFTDTTYTVIDHIFVNILDYVLLGNLAVPCGEDNDIDFYIYSDELEISNELFLASGYPNYILNNDGTIKILTARDEMNQVFYGAYFPSDFTDDNQIKVSYIFSFDYTQR